ASESNARLLVSRAPTTSAIRKPAVSPSAHQSGRSWRTSPVPWSCPAPTSAGLLFADGPGGFHRADIDPSSVAMAGLPHAADDLHRAGDVRVIADQFHLLLGDDLVAECHGVVALAGMQCMQHALDVEQAHSLEARGFQGVKHVRNPVAVDERLDLL